MVDDEEKHSGPLPETASSPLVNVEQAIDQTPPLVQDAAGHVRPQDEQVTDKSNAEVETNQPSTDP